MSERDAFERVVDGLNEAMLDDARWAETSALIDEAFRTKGNVVVFANEPAKGDIEIFFAKCHFRGIDRSAWVREYFRDYYAEDEHPPRLRALPEAKVVPLAELYSDEERKTSRAYNEAFRRFGGRNGVIVLLDGPGGSRITWGIADPVDAGGWSSSQLDMIARVVPHVRQYVRVRSALADAGLSAARPWSSSATPVQASLSSICTGGSWRRTLGRGRCSCETTGSRPRAVSCASRCRRIMIGFSDFWRGRCRASGRRPRAARCW